MHHCYDSIQQHKCVGQFVDVVVRSWQSGFQRGSGVVDCVADGGRDITVAKIRRQTCTQICTKRLPQRVYDAPVAENDGRPLAWSSVVFRTACLRIPGQNG